MAFDLALAVTPTSEDWIADCLPAANPLVDKHAVNTSPARPAMNNSQPRPRYLDLGR